MRRIPHLPGATSSFHCCRMMGKSVRHDKRRCPQGRLRTAHERCWIAVIAGMFYSTQRTFDGLPEENETIW
jgi:hypothetical protein